MVEKTHTSGWMPGIYEPLRNASQRIADWFAPASEAASTEDTYSITVELPGVSPDDIDVSVQDGVLTLKGEKTSSREEKGETWYFSERQYGAFSRSFRLPPVADHDRVNADMKDGVLEISIPKRGQKESDRKKVSINLV